MNQKGFTLLELLTVVGVIATLSAVVLGGYNTGEGRFTLQRSAVQLGQDIRRTSNMAMTGKSDLSFFGEIFPEGGYGIYFAKDHDHYIIFGDCNDNGDYDSSGEAISCASSTVSAPFPEQVEKVSLESEIKIIDISPTSAVSITFFPPDPLIQIRGDDTVLYDDAIITLGFRGDVKTITINKVGLIDID